MKPGSIQYHSRLRSGVLRQASGLAGAGGAGFADGSGAGEVAGAGAGAGAAAGAGGKTWVGISRIELTSAGTLTSWPCR